HGETDNRNILMGSVTAEVIKKALCPVLAIPQSARYKGIKKILYTTDLSYDETAEFLSVIKLARLWNAKVVVLHVSEDSVADEEIMKRLQVFLDKMDYPNVVTAKIMTRDVSAGID